MKQELRIRFLEKRKENRSQEPFVINHLEKLVRDYANIALYMKINSEVDLHALIDKLLLTHSLYFPIVKKELEFRQMKSWKDLGVDRAHIAAPLNGAVIDVAKLDVVIMPCIAANIYGYRLGYGKGYYDRALKEYKGVIIGVVYENCLIEDHFETINDVKMNYIVTEKRIIKID